MVDKKCEDCKLGDTVGALVEALTEACDSLHSEYCGCRCGRLPSGALKCYPEILKSYIEEHGGKTNGSK